MSITSIHKKGIFASVVAQSLDSPSLKFMCLRLDFSDLISNASFFLCAKFVWAHIKTRYGDCVGEENNSQAMKDAGWWKGERVKEENPNRSTWFGLSIHRDHDNKSKSSMSHHDFIIFDNTWNKTKKGRAEAASQCRMIYTYLPFAFYLRLLMWPGSKQNKD